MFNVHAFARRRTKQIIRLRLWMDRRDSPQSTKVDSTVLMDGAPYVRCAHDAANAHGEGAKEPRRRIPCVASARRFQWWAQAAARMRPEAEDDGGGGGARALATSRNLFQA
jgi:hypothetical protein